MHHVSCVMSLLSFEFIMEPTKVATSTNHVARVFFILVWCCPHGLESVGVTRTTKGLSLFSVDRESGVAERRWSDVVRGHGVFSRG